MRRLLFVTLCSFAATSGACTPDWAPPRKGDAGLDAAHEAPDEEGGAEEDSSAPPGEMDGALETDGSASELPQDGGAAAPADADPASPDASCSPGYLLLDGGCRDIDECFEGTHQCHITATCENTQGAYDCTCPLGYSGGTSAGFACAPRIAVGAESNTVWWSCVLLVDGVVQCWGENNAGQLGDGSQTRRFIPGNVNGIDDAVIVRAAGRSVCAIVRDGTVRCWGENGKGQAGDGTTMNRTRPVRVVDLEGVVSLAVAGGHSCAVLSNGTVKCWGDNAKGQLGTGTASEAVVSTPVEAQAVKEAVNVFAYGNQTCAVLRSGVAQCWGDGFLGDAAVTSSLTPVEVKVPATVNEIAIGPFHACSLHGDRHVNCWGPPSLGGNGTLGGDANPRPVFRTSATAIGIGIYSTTILAVDGTMAWWDANTAPATVDDISNVVAMAAFGTRVCEIHKDGTLTCWTILNAKLTPPAVVQGIDLW